MTDFKGGGIPTPDFENEDINFISQKTEFYDDVFVYGKLYAEFGGDVQTFSTAGVERVRITKEGDVAIVDERLRIKYNGKVGIGTDDPQKILHALSSENSVARLETTAATGRLEFKASGTTTNSYIEWNANDLMFETGGNERFRINSNSGVKITVKDDSNDNNISDKTAILIENGGGAGDIGPDSEPTHIDWTWRDNNSNATPQCRISGNVGDGGDPNSHAKEGKGFLTFHCSDTSSTSGDQDPPQRLRIAHNGTFTGSSSNNISDQRLKENISTITDPIAKIKALKGRTFTWKSEANMREGTHYGFIAQEVESIIPDLIVDDTGIRIFDKDDNLLPSNVITPPVGGGYAKSVDSDGVTPVLVEALKEALSKIETLEAKVAALEGS